MLDKQDLQAPVVSGEACPVLHPDKSPIDAALLHLSSALQELVEQQDEIIFRLTGLRREDLKAAKQKESQQNTPLHEQPRGT